MKRFKIHLYASLYVCFMQVKCIVLQLLRGLEYLHHNFIIHRSVTGAVSVKIHSCISSLVFRSSVIVLIHKLSVIACTWREIFCSQCQNCGGSPCFVLIMGFLSSNFSQKVTLLLLKTGEWLSIYRTFYFLHFRCLCRSLDTSKPSSPLTFVLIKAVCESP